MTVKKRCLWRKIHCVFHVKHEKLKKFHTRMCLCMFLHVYMCACVRERVCVCLFCLLGFTAQSTTRSCGAGQLIVVLFLGRLRASKRLTSTKRGQLPLEFNSRNYNISVMFSRLPKDRTLEMEDR